MYVFGIAFERFFACCGREHDLDPGFALKVGVFSLRTRLGHITMNPDESCYKDDADTNVRFIRENAG